MSRTRRKRAPNDDHDILQSQHPYDFNAPRSGDGPVFDRALWHTPMRGGAWTIHGSTVEQFCVPEGSVTVVRCKDCGGRDEHLADYRTMPSDGVAMADAAGMLTRVYTFAQAHEACAVVPRTPVLDPILRDLAEGLAAHATLKLRAGEPVQDAIYLVDEGAVSVVALPGGSAAPPMTEDEERTARAATLWTMREHLRTRARTVLGALHVGECWVSCDPAAIAGTISPHAAPDAAKALVVSVVTPTFGVHLLARMTRADATSRGRACVGEPRWHILRHGCSPLDGVLATTYAPPFA